MMLHRLAIVLLLALLVGCDQGQSSSPTPMAVTSSDSTPAASAPVPEADTPTVPAPMAKTPTTSAAMVKTPTASTATAKIPTASAPPAKTPTVPVATASMPPAETPGSASAQSDACQSSPLQCSDAPPEGIFGQLGLGVAPRVSRPLLVGQHTDLGEIPVGSTPAMWIPEVAPGEAVSLTVTWPTGRVEQLDITANEYGNAGWCWTVMPHEPIGEYKIDVQGRLAPTTGIFKVVRHDSRGILLVPQWGPPGTTFSIALAGFNPRETVRLYLYRDEGPPDSRRTAFVTSLPPVQVNEFGEGIGTMPTQADDPQGVYTITEGQKDSFDPKNTFYVAATPPSLYTPCYVPGASTAGTMPTSAAMKSP